MFSDWFIENQWKYQNSALKVPNFRFLRPNILKLENLIFFFEKKYFFDSWEQKTNVSTWFCEKIMILVVFMRFSPIFHIFYHNRDPGRDSRSWPGPRSPPPRPAAALCFISVLSVFYPGFIPVLSLVYPWFIPVLSLFHPCFIRVLSVFYPCFIRVLSLFHQCFISVSSVFYPCFITVLSLFYPCFISVSSMFYPCLSVFYHLFTFFLHLFNFLFTPFFNLMLPSFKTLLTIARWGKTEKSVTFFKKLKNV